MILVAKLVATAPTAPKRRDAGVPTYPDPGVIQTKPEIAPEQNPTAEIFLSSRQSKIVQTIPPIDAAVFVTIIAWIASRFAPNAL